MISHVTSLGFASAIEDLRDKGLPYPYGEIFDEDDEVERDGYRTTQQQVEELLLAGEKLRSYRAELYTFADGKDDGFMPVKVDDLVTGQRLADAIKARQDVKIAAAADAAKKKKEEENEKARQDAEELAQYRQKAKKASSEETVS